MDATGQRERTRPDSGRRRLARALLATASLATAVLAVDGGIVNATPASKSAASLGAAESTENPYFFDTDADGLVTNRRPSNVSYLLSGAEAWRVEDTRNATAGLDLGFLAEPAAGSMQVTSHLATWGAAAANVETVDTAVGFLTNFESPDLLVLRGDSGRWTPRSAKPAATTLTWYGQMKNGYRAATPLNVAGIDGAPVGVEIITADPNPTTGHPTANYAVLATTKALYLYLVSCTDKEHCTIGPDVAASFPMGSDTVLAIHHTPLSEQSAAGQFEGATRMAVSFGVLLSRAGLLDSSKVYPSIRFVHPFPSVSGWSLVTDAEFRTPEPWPSGEIPGGTPTGGDLRYGVGTYQIPVPGVAGTVLRADVNITRGDDRSTVQYVASSADLAPSPPVRVTNGGCPSPATGFDASYFSAYDAANAGGDLGHTLEAHVVCVAPQATPSAALLGGYSLRQDQAPTYGRDPGEPGGVPHAIKSVEVSGAVVRPQVIAAMPCVEQIRFQTREATPTRTGDFSASSILAALRADQSFLAGDAAWLNAYGCTSRRNGNGQLVPLAQGGSVQATMLLNSAPSGTSPLAPLSKATAAQLVTVALSVPLTPGYSGPGDARTDPVKPRQYLMRTDVPAKTFLTHLPSVDVIERIKLSGDSQNCRSNASDEEKGLCRPRTDVGAPVPIAVLAAPPFVSGTGQQDGATNPEFAVSTDRTSAETNQVSVSVGASLEVAVGVQDPITDSEFSRGVELSYERTADKLVDNSYSEGSQTGYGGSPTKDFILYTTGKYLVYTGVVQSSSIASDCLAAASGSCTEQRPAFLRYPIGTSTQNESLDDLRDPSNPLEPYFRLCNAGATGCVDGVFARGLDKILTHVPGMPGTYMGKTTDPNKELDDYCIGSVRPENGLAEVVGYSPTPPNPFTSPPDVRATQPQILLDGHGTWQTVGSEINNDANNRSTLSVGSGMTNGFLTTDTISAKVSAKNKFALGVSVEVNVGVSASGSITSGYSTSLTEGTSFTGYIKQLPAGLRSETYDWRMFVCKREIVPGVPVWVQNYQTRNYTGIFQENQRGANPPEELGPITAVSPIQSATVPALPTLTWDQPTGTAKSYTVEVEAMNVGDARSYKALEFATLSAALERKSTNSFQLPAGAPLLAGHVYRWRVVANSFLTTSVQSEWAYFRVEGAPVGPDPGPDPTPLGLPRGYRIVENDGPVYGFGVASSDVGIRGPAVAIAEAPNEGFWVLRADGVVIARNGAKFFGSVDPTILATGERASTMAGVPDGSGYWIFTNRGRAFAFGSAQFFGDMSKIPLNGPVIASVPTVSGKGYWMIASDGGVFSFGDAKFFGSMGGKQLNAPVVGIAPDPDGVGYWLVATDGGIFAFDAAFKGSMPGLLKPGERLNGAVVGAVAYGGGYLMVGADGGVFNFSGAPFFGSLGSNPPKSAIVGVAPMH